MNPTPHSSYWLPPLLGRGREAIDSLVLGQHAVIAIAFFGWLAFFVYCLVKYRAKRSEPLNEKPLPKAKWAEITLLVVELGLLFLVSVPVFGRFRAEAKEPAAIELRVIGEQYAWNIHYPGKDGVFGVTRIDRIDEADPIGIDRASPGGADDFVTVNELHVPENTSVRVRLGSKDVIHGFFLPVLRIKQDAIPGMETPVRFEATKTGSYDIACAQLCGLAHYRMRGALIVETREAYNQWTTEREKERQEATP